MKSIVGNNVCIIWTDSYGVTSGWQDISGYHAEKLLVESFGKVIYEDDKVISLAHNFAEETDNTIKQANGIMVIPKACIEKITSFSSCQEIELEQKQQRSLPS